MAMIAPENRESFFLKLAKSQYEGYPDEVHKAAAAYQNLSFSKIGALEPVYRKPNKYRF